MSRSRLRPTGGPARCNKRYRRSWLLACYREGINAHLTAAVAMAEESPGGLLMPNQSLLYTGRVLASSQLNPMMHLCRELCGGQICVTPDFAAFQDPETAPWLEKYYTINAD